MASGKDGLLAKWRRIRYSIASTGLRRGLADTALVLLTYHPDRDDPFDRECGTDTGGRVPPAELGIADAVTRDNAILYLASPARVTRWMLEHVGIAHREFAFVDLGCGKGRVVLVASEYPFRKIVGVEISSALSACARDNVERYQPRRRVCRDVEIQTADATAFDWPAMPLLVHLYHPFEPVLTEAVLARLEESVRSTPRRVVVAYLLYADAVPAVERAFARFPWLRRTRHEQSVLGHYDWLFYSN